MNVINYDKEMKKIAEAEKKQKRFPTLLLHSCCAPCSSACIERLKDYFDITVYYYNPNIDTAEEYRLRAEEQERFCKEVGVKVIIEERRESEFYAAAKGLEDAPEGGSRCEKCFNLRLGETAEYAKKNGYEYFATTLTVSPLKNSALINELGIKIGEEKGVKYLPSDFKKGGGYYRSVELSKEYGLYRQNYCGCEFSKRKLC